MKNTHRSVLVWWGFLPPRPPFLLPLTATPPSGDQICAAGEQTRHGSRLQPAQRHPCPESLQLQTPDCPPIALTPRRAPQLRRLTRNPQVRRGWRCTRSTWFAHPLPHILSSLLVLPLPPPPAVGLRRPLSRHEQDVATRKTEESTIIRKCLARTEKQVRAAPPPPSKRRPRSRHCPVLIHGVPWLQACLPPARSRTATRGSRALGLSEARADTHRCTLSLASTRTRT